MKWLARLKLQQSAGSQPTEPTKPGFVGSVGGLDEALQKTLTLPAVANDEIVDPDRWCWPHSSAMNGSEIDNFLARLGRFTDAGLDLDNAEQLADKLVIRDREQDERRSCLECAYLRRDWRCGNWQAAGVANQPQDARLPRDVVLQLQRCDGFVKHAAGIFAEGDGPEQHLAGGVEMDELPDP